MDSFEWCISVFGRGIDLEYYTAVWIIDREMLSTDGTQDWNNYVMVF